MAGINGVLRISGCELATGKLPMADKSGAPAVAFLFAAREPSCQVVQLRRVKIN
jgi:hypothetical protein